jgi:hypothetical protein
LALAGLRSSGWSFKFVAGHQLWRQQPKTGLKMKTTVDLKSVALGLLAGIIVMFAIGAGTSPGDADGIGRYQVSAGTGGCAVMVDTKTGQAWAFQPLNTAQWKNDANFWGAK